MSFLNRYDAGRQLAALLQGYTGSKPVVLGLPRGGVPVAFEVASALRAPLDAWCVRKIGAPNFPELGMGAVAEGGLVFIDPDTVVSVGASSAEVTRSVRTQSAEVAEGAKRFREGRPRPDLAGRTVIIVDDGLATGSTARAAIDAVRAAGAAVIVLAIPVAATQSLAGLRDRVDDIVCVTRTSELFAIGAWYDDFTQVTDEEVVQLLRVARSAQGSDARPIPENREWRAQAAPVEFSIPVAGQYLEAALTLPTDALGLVLFAHGSGSSRFSPRNRQVAKVLASRKIATLLFDLLTPDEEAKDAVTAELRFDIALLTARLVEATRWAIRTPMTRDWGVGYFGASTGAAAALLAATVLPSVVKAVVSRGGRPDLAGEGLAQVRAPTLLIVGGEDREVLALNQNAAARLTRAEWDLVVVPGAAHLFEEAGALDVVARLAGDWFEAHLSPFSASAVDRPAGPLTSDALEAYTKNPEPNPHRSTSGLS